MARITKEEEEKRKKQRGLSLGERDRAELAQARAKRRGMVAVKTPEGFEEKTPEQAQITPSVPEQERLVIEQERLKKEEEMKKVEVETIIQERKAGREGAVEVSIPTEEIAPVEGVAPIEEQPQQEFYTDPVTGEQTPLLSGGVMPITSEDLTDVALMFTGLGFAKIGVKGAFKTLLAKAGKHALPRAGANIVKKGMLKAITKKISSKIGIIAGAIVIGELTRTAGMFVSPYITQKVTAEDRQIRSIDTAMSQVRETITLPIQLVKAGAPLEDCLEQVDSLRDTVLYGEQRIQELKIDSYEMKTNPEFTFPMTLRINKLKGFLDLTERQLVIAQVSGEAITAEALTELMMAYEEIFGSEE